MEEANGSAEFEASGQQHRADPNPTSTVSHPTRTAPLCIFAPKIASSVKRQGRVEPLSYTSAD